MQEKLQRTVKHLRDKIKSISEDMAIEPRHTTTEHFYYIPRLRETFPSVSGEHRNIKDPSIRNFEKNETLRFIKNHVSEFIEAYSKMDMDKIDALLKEASESGIKARDKAGATGSWIHEMREQYFYDWILSEKTDKPIVTIESYAKYRQGQIPPEFYLDVISGCSAMDKFVKDTGYIPLGCELYVYDEKKKVAGTLDDVGLMPIDGEYKLVILDVKSSNQLKDFYTLQVCMYQNMFKKLFHLIPKKILIVKVSKKDRSYEMEIFKPEQILNGHRANHYLNLFNKYWEGIRENRKKEYLEL